MISHPQKGKKSGHLDTKLFLWSCKKYCIEFYSTLNGVWQHNFSSGSIMETLNTNSDILYSSEDNWMKITQTERNFMLGERHYAPSLGHIRKAGKRILIMQNDDDWWNNEATISLNGLWVSQVRATL